jgi:hypothetical protein
MMSAKILAARSGVPENVVRGVDSFVAGIFGSFAHETTRGLIGFAN